MPSDNPTPPEPTGTDGSQEATGVVPLTFGQKKKSGTKPKVRVRPTLKKNSSSNKRKVLSNGNPKPTTATVNTASKIRRAVGTSVGVSVASKKAGEQTSKSASVSVATSENSQSGANGKSTQPNTGEVTAPDAASNSVSLSSTLTTEKHNNKETLAPSSTATASIRSPTTNKDKATVAVSSSSVPIIKPVVRSPNTNINSNNGRKIIQRKPIRKPIKPSRRIAPSKKGSLLASRKGHGISVGSSHPQHQHQRHRLLRQQQRQIPTATEENENSTPASASNETSNNNNNNNQNNNNVTQSGSNKSQKEYLPEEDIIPYQHLGQIDPALKIAPPKEGEKSMKDFCTKFKIPRAERKGNKSGANAPASGTNNTNEHDGNGTGNGNGNGNGKGNNGDNNRNRNPNTTATTEDDSQEEPTIDSRSGPRVEIINGEIVVQESSMIVGGRRTTEEVDRELEGTIVVEENTGITATYNSFTKRQKTQRWTVEETRKFYLALRQCGTDFTTMESFFDGTAAADANGNKSKKRTRKQLKSKYLRECRKNLHLIDMAMNPKVQLPLDMSVFGELDMAAVQDTVVPLGQATATSSAGVVTPATSTSPTPTPGSGGGEDDMQQVVVEDAEQENAANAAATAAALVTQEDAASALSAKALDAVLGAVTPSTTEDLTVHAMTVTPQTLTLGGQEGSQQHTEEVNNVPLLAIPTNKKKKQRPKFRARAKPKPKGKGKVKRVVNK